MIAAIALDLLDGPVPTPPPPAKPTFQTFDMGGGGGGGPRYELVDYVNVLAAFREIPGEHPVARAARRSAHLIEGLALIRKAKKADEHAMAVGMLYGAALERSAAEQAARDTSAAAAVPARVATVQMGTRSRPERQTSIGGAVAVFLVGMGTAIAISRRLSR